MCTTVDDDEADVLRILVASDMHLGYAERDPVRGDDSFQTFAEVFKLANENRVGAYHAMRRPVPWPT